MACAALLAGVMLAPRDPDDVAAEGAEQKQWNRLALARWHARVCGPLQEPSMRQGWQALVWQKECRPRRVRWVRRCNGCLHHDCVWLRVVDP